MKQNQFTIKDINNIEENPEAVLKLRPIKLNKTSKEYLKTLKKQDYIKNKNLVKNLTNAIHINNSIKEMKKLKKYNITFKELQSIAPKLCSEYEENPRFLDINDEKFENEKNELKKKGVKVTVELTWIIHCYHKEIKALREMNINEINNYVGIVRYLTKIRGKKIIFELFDIRFPGSKRKTEERKKFAEMIKEKN